MTLDSAGNTRMLSLDVAAQAHKWCSSVVNGTCVLNQFAAADLAAANWVAGGGTAQAQTATYTPAVAALVDGLTLCWKPTAANTAAAPTFAPNGLTAHPIVKAGGALIANDLITTAQACAIYDSTGTQWELQNPQTVNASTINTGNVNQVATYPGTGTTVGPKSLADLTPTLFVAGGGIAQAQTAALSPAATALTTGMSVCWLPIAANTAAAPTLAVNGLTAKPITKLGTTALVASDLTSVGGGMRNL